MRALLVVAALLALALLPAPASAAPPECPARDVGEDGDKVSAQVWVRCGPHASVTTCPKDGFCRTWSTHDYL